MYNYLIKIALAFFLCLLVLIMLAFMYRCMSKMYLYLPHHHKNNDLEDATDII